jgi:hypothetical protein
LKHNVQGSKNDSTHHDKPIVISTCVVLWVDIEKNYL